jgi:hypothetical protein
MGVYLRSVDATVRGTAHQARLAGVAAASLI